MLGINQAGSSISLFHPTCLKPVESTCIVLGTGGAAAEWSTVGSASTDKNGVLSLSSFEPYPYKVYVGTPNMAAVAEHLLNRVVEHLEVRPDIMRSSVCLPAASKAAENNPAPQ